MKIVYLGGVFDLFHIGHLNLLKRAKELGDVLVVSVSTDEVVEKYKRKPIIPFEQRFAIIEAIKYVDKVIPRCDIDESIILDLIRPDIITYGYEEGKKPHCKEWLKGNIAKVVVLPYTKGISTTDLIQKIKNGKDNRKN